MSTEQIFARLNRLGVAVTPKGFRRAAQRHESAERLAPEWSEPHVIHPEDPDDDRFVWMAAIVPRRRLVPDRVCFEQIDDRMQEGYRLLEQGRAAEASDVWRHVWEWLERKVMPARHDLAGLPSRPYPTGAACAGEHVPGGARGLPGVAAGVDPRAGTCGRHV